MPVFNQFRHCVSAALPVLGPSLSNTLGLRDVLSEMVFVFSTVTFLLIFDILYYSSPNSLRRHSPELSPPPPLRGAGETPLSPRAWPREDDGTDKEVRVRLPGTGPRLARGPGGG